MVERLEVITKGVEKGSREKIEKRERNKRQFEEKDGLRDPHPFLECSRSGPVM